MSAARRFPPLWTTKEIDRRAAGKAFKKHAHAVSELLGNKAVKSLYAKMTLPYRHAGAVIGKKGSADHGLRKRQRAHGIQGGQDAHRPSGRRRLHSWSMRRTT
jgi:hypothetical protein